MAGDTDLFLTLAARIEEKRDDLIALTQDLVRIPTLNPPGENYREICSYISERLSKRGFEMQMIRAEGTPGDSVKYPRWNIVARIICISNPRLDRRSPM